MSSKLMLSSGKIFKDYLLLEKYLEICPENERGKSLPSSPDIEFVKYLASRGVGSLNMYLDELTRRFEERVNPAYCVKAVKEVLGTEVPEDRAVRIISTQLAGWTLEIAEALGIIKIRYPYRIS